ncbi:MAG: ferritin [Chloroflexota bacterium]
MIVKEKLVEALNGQIRSEFTASAQYLAISVYFDVEALPDLAAFFSRQAAEEHLHAMKFVRFILDAGGKPIIPGMPELRNEFGSAAEAVRFALEQEVKVTDQINHLVSLSIQEGDHITHNFLQWFVTEQVEEVATMTNLLQTIKHAGNNLLLVEEYVRRRPQHQGQAAPAEAEAA